jgi:hypothetical protein
MNLPLEVLLELGQRAVRCKNWKWLHGMRWVDYETGEAGRVDANFSLPPELIPDFSDPATLGCLLHLNRLSSNKPDLFAYHLGANVWRVGNFELWITTVLRNSNEVDALLTALESF